MTMNKNIFIFSNDRHFQFIELQQKEAENKEFESEFTATTALVKRHCVY